MILMWFKWWIWF